MERKKLPFVQLPSRQSPVVLLLPLFSHVGEEPRTGGRRDAARMTLPSSVLPFAETRMWLVPIVVGLKRKKKNRWRWTAERHGYTSVPQ